MSSSYLSITEKLSPICLSVRHARTSMISRIRFALKGIGICSDDWCSMFEQIVQGRRCTVTITIHAVTFTSCSNNGSRETFETVRKAVELVYCPTRSRDFFQVPHLRRRATEPVGMLSFYGTKDTAKNTINLRCSNHTF